MKTIMTGLIALLFTASAYAGEFSQPVSVLFQSASTWVPALKVCRDGNYLKHKQKDYIAVEYCHNDSGTNCEVVHKRLLQPVVGVAKRCAKSTGRDGNHCAVWESYPLDQSKVKVFTYTSEHNMREGKGGRLNGTYTIPNCAKTNY